MPGHGLQRIEELVWPSTAVSITIMPIEESWAIRMGKAWASRPRAAVNSMGRHCRMRTRLSPPKVA
jgi:hypothetical protein